MYLLNGTSIIVAVILNIVWALAICLSTSPGLISWTIYAKGFKNGINISVPNILNIKCMAAALWAVLFAPILAIKAVTHVPILHPNSIGKTIFIVIEPVDAKAINIPVVADELCNIAVRTKPVNIPKIQLSSIAIISCENIGDSANGFKAELIIPIPINKIPKPNIISAISFLFFCFADINKTTPTITNNGAISSNLKATSWAVIVVPTFAPMITPAACARFIRPALTNPTTITVVALELCITIVTKAPTKTADIGFLVTFSNILFNLSPAAFSNPSPINFIPKRNRPNPPATSIKVKIASFKILLLHFA